MIFSDDFPEGSQEERLDETSSVSPEQHNDPLQACQLELEQSKSRYLYLNAEFDNFKKRTLKERSVWIDTAQDQALIDLLAVYDNMDRARTEIETQALPEEARAHFKGFELIMKSFDALLKKYGVEEIAPSKTFDPAVCEAVMQQESPDHTADEIIAVLQKGYQRNGRILRPAKVSVAR